ncbi:MAG: preprotein translocase subunit Sec61beta [Candidatus Hadarchaeota archaeon]
MPKSEQRMPSTGAGLIRYFDEEGKGIKISPKKIVIFISAVIILEILIRLYGQSILGF